MGKTDLKKLLPALGTLLVLLIVGLLIFFFGGQNNVLGTSGAKWVGGFIVFLALLAFFINLVGMKNKYAEIIVRGTNEVVGMFFGGFLVFNPATFSAPPWLHIGGGAVLFIVMLVFLVLEVMAGLKKR